MSRTLIDYTPDLMSYFDLDKLNILELVRPYVPVEIVL